MFSTFLWMKLYYTGECRTNIVISIDVRHIFFMWSVFAIKHLMYRFVKPLLTISVGCLPIWVMAIECPQVMIMAYLLNKEWEIGLLIEQEMYNLLLENYAEYFLLSWIFTDMGIRWCVHRRLLHVVTMDIQAFVPLWHRSLYPGMFLFILIVPVSEEQGWNVGTVGLLFQI